MFSARDCITRPAQATGMKQAGVCAFFRYTIKGRFSFATKSQKAGSVTYKIYLSPEGFLYNMDVAQYFIAIVAFNTTHEHLYFLIEAAELQSTLDWNKNQ